MGRLIRGIVTTEPVPPWQGANLRLECGRTPRDAHGELLVSHARAKRGQPRLDEELQVHATGPRHVLERPPDEFLHLLHGAVHQGGNVGRHADLHLGRHLGGGHVGHHGTRNHGSHTHGDFRCSGVVHCHVHYLPRLPCLHYVHGLLIGDQGPRMHDRCFQVRQRVALRDVGPALRPPEQTLRRVLLLLCPAPVAEGRLQLLHTHLQRPVALDPTVVSCKTEAENGVEFVRDRG